MEEREDTFVSEPGVAQEKPQPEETLPYPAES